MWASKHGERAAVTIYHSKRTLKCPRAIFGENDSHCHQICGDKQDFVEVSVDSKHQDRNDRCSSGSSNYSSYSNGCISPMNPMICA